VRYSGLKRRKSVAARRSQKRQERVKFAEFREGRAVQIHTSAAVQLRGRPSTGFQWANFLWVDFPEGLSYRFQTAVKFLISLRAKIIIKTLNAGFPKLGFQGKQLCNV
jgi:hypothetical protein